MSTTPGTIRGQGCGAPIGGGLSPAGLCGRVGLCVTCWEKAERRHLPTVIAERDVFRGLAEQRERVLREIAEWLPGMSQEGIHHGLGYEGPRDHARAALRSSSDRQHNEEPCPDCGFTGPYDGHVCEEHSPTQTSMGREGMVTVWNHDGTYAGCLGVDSWALLLTRNECIAHEGWHYFEKGLPACRCGRLSEHNEEPAPPLTAEDYERAKADMPEKVAGEEPCNECGGTGSRPVPRDMTGHTGACVGWQYGAGGRYHNGSCDCGRELYAISGEGQDG